MTMLFQNYFTKTSLEALNSIAANGSGICVRAENHKGNGMEKEKLKSFFLNEA